ncbi:hypothetical protein UlMin_001751 [Ulmus minor]
MGIPQSPNPPHLYPQALQLKLYQAFIFSIPILFSIILFLLFYLFYLKRRASTVLSSSASTRPRRTHQTTTYVSSPCQLDLKEEFKDKLPIVQFDEELKKKDSQCCVCLGDFIIKEELLQVPSCKHVFHIDCIHLWIHTNTTCPLCRCSVISSLAAKQDENPVPPPTLAEPIQQQEESTSSTIISVSMEELTTTPLEESSSGNPDRNENVSYTEQGSVIINIQTHDS